MSIDKTDFVTDDNTGGYFVCECECCGHVFSSEHASGGAPLADSGDYDDIRCPKCDDIAPPGCENPERVWNVQQEKINNLKAYINLFQPAENYVRKHYSVKLGDSVPDAMIRLLEDRDRLEKELEKEKQSHIETLNIINRNLFDEVDLLREQAGFPKI